MTILQFTNAAAPQRLFALLQKGAEVAAPAEPPANAKEGPWPVIAPGSVAVSIKAPADLVDRLDITEDWFSLVGFAESRKKALALCTSDPG